MEFLDPHEKSEEDFRDYIRELSVTTVFGYEYLWQEIRRAEMNNAVVVLVDKSHHLDLSRATLSNNPHEDIEKFIQKWAPRPDEVEALDSKEA